ncbi:hypothetical protein L873DRAFT_1813669 [Choiromyces venosus 120613-1]|uniref:Methionyl/Leucyl tRNA synthetase domain-containing protein n=1 Tax=Choiromyces venosus 120613-1 TaxID=1336337 RepID=A0A3N4JC63_9PEZI|nr:hypothetical protein L873DRAFT_1813669 [Choiromyces venosus 120613-1]
MPEGAEMADITPREFCDVIVDRFKNQAGANAPYEIVIRTSSPALAEAIKCIWRRMEDSGYIYVGKHRGWYSIRAARPQFSRSPSRGRNSWNGQKKQTTTCASQPSARGS